MMVVCDLQSQEPEGAQLASSSAASDVYQGQPQTPAVIVATLGGLPQPIPTAMRVAIMYLKSLQTCACEIMLDGGVASCEYVSSVSTVSNLMYTCPYVSGV